MSGLDLTLLRQWVGRERLVRDPLGPFPAQALAAALDRAPPAAGAELPPAWHWLYFLDAPAAAATGRDGHAATGAFLPPVPLPRRMWAAGNMELLRPLRLEQPAERSSVIKAVDAKDGKSGPLVFVTLEHRYSQDSQLCIREEQSLVYRAMPAAPQALPPGESAPSGAQWTRSVAADPVLLFRYSALTYNGHRIHYDRPYAMAQEFYPALVVHGPLLATLLLELAGAQLPRARLAAFRFRALRPTFDDAPFTLCGRRDGELLSLWSQDSQGLLCMSAEARLA
jgi:3-methylfumaryl-CoA hydratase